MRFVFQDVPVDIKPGGQLFTEAKVIARSVDQSGPSFEVRVFLNNPDADDSTPLDEKHGYAGSFHVYGFGLDRAEQSVSHKLPTDYAVPATRAIRDAVKRSPVVSVTLVPRYYNTRTTASAAFHLDGVSITTR